LASDLLSKQGTIIGAGIISAAILLVNYWIIPEDQQYVLVPGVLVSMLVVPQGAHGDRQVFEQTMYAASFVFYLICFYTIARLVIRFTTSKKR
jgi:hypothetical protein